MDLTEEVCPLLQRAELPSNEPDKVTPKYVWLPRPGTKESPLSRCVHQDADLDMGWFKEQLAFLKSLTPADRDLLRSYSRTGDEVINTVLQGGTLETAKPMLLEVLKKLKRPVKAKPVVEVIDASGDRRLRSVPIGEVVRPYNLFSSKPLSEINESNIVEVAQDYVRRFIAVFERVPVLTKPLRVFRGVIPPPCQRRVFPLRGFSSTTYDPFSASLNTFTEDMCCVMDIVLEPGVRALWIEPISHFEMEREVLVDSRSVTTEIPKDPIRSTIVFVKRSSEVATPGKEKPISMDVFKCTVKPKEPTGVVARGGTMVSPFSRTTGGAYLPPKYFKGLSTRKARARTTEITRRATMKTSDPKAYRPFTTDKGVKTRKSSYTERFHRKYPGVTGLPDIAKATDVPLSTLKTVYDRGMAAWRTGHRPGASQQAWGMARVHSFVMHGKTWRTADKDLAKK